MDMGITVVISRGLSPATRDASRFAQAMAFGLQVSDALRDMITCCNFIHIRVQTPDQYNQLSMKFCKPSKSMRLSHTIKLIKDHN